MPARQNMLILIARQAEAFHFIMNFSKLEVHYLYFKVHYVHVLVSLACCDYHCVEVLWMDAGASNC
jgi:hypothetical protein